MTDPTRRRVLELGAAALGAGLVGCGDRRGPADGADIIDTDETGVSRVTDCVVRPRQTEGPYFVDEELLRSDVRSDPSDGSVRPGRRLTLTLRVGRAAGATCAPVVGALVDLWSCDAGGIYSGVVDGGSDTRGALFLRGQQLTDGAGEVTFVTIFPGWYPGRTVHVHFKVRTDAEAFTSQLYFDDAVADAVFSEAPYVGRAGRRVRNDGDGLFASGGRRLVVTLTDDGDGLTGTFRLALA